MGTHRTSRMDASSAELFVMEVVHDEAGALLRIVEETCLRNPVSDELTLVRYLLEMLVEATMPVDGTDPF